MSTEYLATLIQSTFTKEEIAAFVKHEVPIGELRQYLAERSIENFARLYFAQKFSEPFAPIHEQFIQDIDSILKRLQQEKPGTKKAYAIPRGHSKTTWFAQLLPLYALLYGFSPLTVLLGATQTSTDRLLKNIEILWNESPELQEDFDSPKFGIERIEYEGSVILGFGIGSGAIRGVTAKKRPTLVIGDDLDTDNSVRSKVELDANKDWFDRAVLQLGDNVHFTTSFIMIGTIIRKTSLLKYVLDSPDFQSIIKSAVIRFADNEDLWKQWRENIIALAKDNQQPAGASEDSFYQQHRDELLQGTEMLWSRQDAYREAMLYRLMKPEAFNSELQQNPQEMGSFGSVQFIPLPNENEYHLLCALDSTVTGSKTSDYAAYVEILYHPRKKEMVVSYADVEQRSYKDTIDAIARRMQYHKARERRVRGFWVETNSAGSVITDLLKERLGKEQIPLYVNGIYNSIPKVERISTLSEYIGREQLYFVDTLPAEALAELDMWPNNKHDDFLDACSTIVMYLRDKGMLDLIRISEDEAWKRAVSI